MSENRRLPSLGEGAIGEGVAVLYCYWERSNLFQERTLVTCNLKNGIEINGIDYPQSRKEANTRLEISPRLFSVEMYWAKIYLAIRGLMRKLSVQHWAKCQNLHLDDLYKCDTMSASQWSLVLLNSTLFYAHIQVTRQTNATGGKIQRRDKCHKVYSAHIWAGIPLFIAYSKKV